MKKRTWFIIGGIALLLTAAGVFAVLYRDIRPFARMEFGADAVDPGLFTDNEQAEAEWTEEDLKTGTHVVTVTAGKRKVGCILSVKDTIPPSADPIEVTVPMGTEPGPDAFTENLEDAGIVKVYFLEEPDFASEGTHPVRIGLMDASGNFTEIASSVTICTTRDGVTAEAGSEIPDAAEFLYPGFHAVQTDPVTEQMMHTPGTYRIRFSYEGKEYASTLTVTDTVSPEAEGLFILIHPEKTLSAEECVKNIRDETEVTCSFVKEIDYADRSIQTVTVRVEDLGKNSIEVTSEVLISALDPVTVEAKKEPLSEEELGLTDFIFTEPFVPDKVGTHYILMERDGEKDYLIVTVEDTTPPAVSSAVSTVYTNHPQKAEEMIRIDDVSAWTAEYTEEPDWTKAGEQEYTVKAADEYGNAVEWTGTVLLEKDKKAPSLYGVVDRSVYIGEAIRFYRGVYAIDEIDGDLEITVDTSKLDRNTEGTYPVTYRATDLSGNTVEKTCKFTVYAKSVTDEEISAVAQDILSKITTPDMVRAEVLNAIFWYVHDHMKYIGVSNKNNWRDEAMSGFTTGVGDCFTTYSMTRALLDETDIDYMSVKRLSWRTRHYWVIVNLGTGWYHFDPLVTPKRKELCFMWTNKQTAPKGYYWRYTRENYPPIATELFDYEKIVQMEKDGLLP